MRFMVNVGPFLVDVKKVKTEKIYDKFVEKKRPNDGAWFIGQDLLEL